MTHHRAARTLAAVALLAASGGVATLSAGTVAATPAGSLTIVKNTVGGDGTFGFEGDLGAFSIGTSGGTGSQSFNVPAGTYTVIENVPDGWTLDGFICDANFVSGSGAISVIVDVASGAEVTCTFTNSVIPDDGVLTIVKETVGGDGTFGFEGDLGAFSIGTSGGTGSQSFNVPAGTYIVGENVPDGWTLDGFICDANFVSGSGAISVIVDVAAGAEVTCTFTNSLDPPATTTSPTTTSPPTTSPPPPTGTTPPPPTTPTLPATGGVEPPWIVLASIVIVLGGILLSAFGRRSTVSRPDASR